MAGKGEGARGETYSSGTKLLALHSLDAQPPTPSPPPRSSRTKLRPFVCEVLPHTPSLSRHSSNPQPPYLHPFYPPPVSCPRTKLRPFVYEFLDAVKEQYELHIYTMGDKHYAAEIRRLLDPTGRLFASVISQNESTSSLAKHLDVALVHVRDAGCERCGGGGSGLGGGSRGGGRGRSNLQARFNHPAVF